MPQATSQAWRLIESPPAGIASHMALDRELFEAFLKDPETPPLLRIYRVTEPSISVGRSYRNRKQGEVCVRPTGGGLVEHGRDLIYSVIARRDTFPTFHQVRTSYLSFHEAVCAAFQKFGIEARLLRCDEAKRNTGLGECFRDPVATDVLVDGKKAAGGAQWRRGRNFLHQGSVRLMRGISFEALKPALIESVADLFGIVWRPG